MPPAVDNRIPNPPEAPLEIYRDPNHRDPHPVAAPPPSYDELYPNGAPPAPAPQPVAIIPPAVPEEAYEVIQAPAPEGINPNVPPRAHDKNHIYLKKDDELSIREKNEINNKDQERISSAAPEKIIYKDDQEVCYKSEDSPKEDDEAVKNKNIKNNPSYYQNKNHNNDTYAPYDQNRKSTDDRKIGRNDPRPVMLSPK